MTRLARASRQRDDSVEQLDTLYACAVCLQCLKLPAPRTMVQDGKRFICSSLLVQAFLFVGHPISGRHARSVVPRDFESAAGFEVLMQVRRSDERDSQPFLVVGAYGAELNRSSVTERAVA